MCVQLLLLYKSIYKNFQNHAKVRLWIIPLKLAKSARGANESLSEKAQKNVAFVALVNARIPDPSASKSLKFESPKTPLNVATILVLNPSVPPEKQSDIVRLLFCFYQVTTSLLTINPTFAMFICSRKESQCQKKENSAFESNSSKEEA